MLNTHSKECSSSCIYIILGRLPDLSFQGSQGSWPVFQSRILTTVSKLSFLSFLKSFLTTFLSFCFKGLSIAYNLSLSPFETPAILKISKKTQFALHLTSQLLYIFILPPEKLTSWFWGAVLKNEAWIFVIIQHNLNSLNSQSKADEYEYIVIWIICQCSPFETNHSQSHIETPSMRVLHGSSLTSITPVPGFIPHNFSIIRLLS